MPRIRSQQDFFGGLMLIVLGAGAWWVISSLAAGSASRMGAAYLPRLFSIVLILIGAAMSARSFFSKHEDRLERWPIPRLLVVLIPIMIFGYTVKPLGLVLSGFILCLLSAMAAVDRRMTEALIVAVVLPLLTAALFIAALGLPLPAWPDPAHWPDWMRS